MGDPVEERDVEKILAVLDDKRVRRKLATLIEQELFSEKKEDRNAGTNGN